MTLSMFLGLLVGSLSFASEDGDWQFWSSGSIEGDLTNSWKLKLEEQFRLGDRMADLYYRYTDIGATWKAVPWFNLGWNYGHLYQKKNGVWKEENRPHVSGTLIWRWHGVKIEDRNRLERRIREDVEDLWMYRNKLALGLPTGLTRFDVQLHVAQEIFVHLDESEVYRNRLSAGWKGQLTPFLKADLLYHWQSTRAVGNWIDEHVIGVQIQIAM